MPIPNPQHHALLERAREIAVQHLAPRASQTDQSDQVPVENIRRLAEAGMTMLVVTHEVRFARDVADRVVFMDEGQIVEQGPPEQVLDHPSQERTQRFLRMVERQVV